MNAAKRTKIKNAEKVQLIRAINELAPAPRLGDGTSVLNRFQTRVTAQTCLELYEAVTEATKWSDFDYDIAYQTARAQAQSKMWIGRLRAAEEAKDADAVVRMAEDVGFWMYRAAAYEKFYKAVRELSTK